MWLGVSRVSEASTGLTALQQQKTVKKLCFRLKRRRLIEKREGRKPGYGKTQGTISFIPVVGWWGLDARNPEVKVRFLQVLDPDHRKSRPDGFYPGFPDSPSALFTAFPALWCCVAAAPYVRPSWPSLSFAATSQGPQQHPGHPSLKEP